MVENLLDRRTVLKAAGAAAGAAAVLAPLSVAAPASAASSDFQHGVASGDPLPDGVLLWTRVTPVPEATPGSGRGPRVSVGWQVATDPSFGTVVAAGTAVTGPERDHTVKVDVRGLRPGTRYWYRFSYAGTSRTPSVWSAVGRTRTAPAPDVEVAGLRFGVVSCSNRPGPSPGTPSWPG